MTNGNAGPHGFMAHMRRSAPFAKTLIFFVPSCVVADAEAPRSHHPCESNSSPRGGGLGGLRLSRSEPPKDLGPHAPGGRASHPRGGRGRASHILSPHARPVTYRLPPRH